MEFTVSEVVPTLAADVRYVAVVFIVVVPDTVRGPSVPVPVLPVVAILPFVAPDESKK